MNLFWVGTDVWILNNMHSSFGLLNRLTIWKKRLLTKYLFDRYASGHIVVAEHLGDELRQFGIKKPIRVIPDVSKYDKLGKQPHKGFNVLYYLREDAITQKFADWLYGKDIVADIITSFPAVNFIRVNGKQDMNKVYPIVDFYIRPNRHDGEPRMIAECEINGIPYYWSKESPNVHDIIEKLKLQMNRSII